MFIFSHGDIFLLDFEDNYRNLTLKTMLSLRWALDECQKFKYVLKTDDDMIVNFDVLIRQLVKLPAKLTNGEIYFVSIPGTSFLHYQCLIQERLAYKEMTRRLSNCDQRPPH